MNTLRRRLGLVMDDIRHGRHIEAYAFFLLGLALVGLGLFDVVDSRRLLQFTVAALAFLVFRTAAPAEPAPVSADDVLHRREDLGPLRTLLERARDLRVYGPTAINVLAGADDLRRLILQRGGTVRIAVLDPAPRAVADAAVQLDDNLDLDLALRGSLHALRRMEGLTGFECRRLPVNPGFSLLIVNGDSPDGTIVVEFHGFRDSTIDDRMHLRLDRRTSPHWYDYWLGRFDAVWAASLPGTTGTTAGDADPEAGPR
ncbi:hypothetical protein [Streptomyces sp. NPDC001068]|uniref:hypothetical protein n=1 Tax=Streptomyces sp. NPDC001068 TaxID=3364544 RepID=UPI0036A987CC